MLDFIFYFQHDFLCPYKNTPDLSNCKKIFCAQLLIHLIFDGGLYLASD